MYIERLKFNLGLDCEAYQLSYNGVVVGYVDLNLQDLVLPELNGGYVISGDLPTSEMIEQLKLRYPEPQPEPEPAYVPTTISMRQARLQLITLGVYSIFLSALSQMGQSAQVEAEYAATVDRENPLTQAMIQLFQWSQEEADQYFIEASKL